MAVTNNAAPSRLGQVNKAGDAKALFEKIYTNEVKATFAKKNLMMPLTMSRTITHGKSASFPVFGIVGGGYHTPGESVIEGDNGYLQKAGHNEKVISIDEPLVSPVFIADIDEAMNSWEVRSHYTRESGVFLANRADLNILKTIILAARASSPLAATIVGIRIVNPGAGYGSAPTLAITGGGGSGATATCDYNSATGEIDEVTLTAGGTGFTSAPTITPTGGTPTTAATFEAILDVPRHGTVLSKGSTVRTTASKIVEALYEANEVLDEKNIPEEDRAAVLPVDIYYRLMNDAADTTKLVMNKDWGGTGSIASRVVPTVAGMPIFKSNNFPSRSVVSAITGENNTYNGDFSQTCGVVFHKSCAGTVKLRDLSLATDDQMAERLGWLYTAFYYMGHGNVRPESSVEISAAT